MTRCSFYFIVDFLLNDPHIPMIFAFAGGHRKGKVRERFNRQSWKDCVSEMAPRVRIPPFPH